MWRIIQEMNAKGKIESKVHGVLTDYDLSSRKKDLKKDYKKTSQQRTGTPPYMAQELLKGTSRTHLYRHDVESLFYIMLLMSARHTIETPEGEEKPRVVMRRSTPLPYQDWFNEPRYHILGSIKGTFFSDMGAIELSPAFEGFRGWLKGLQYCFYKGFLSKGFELPAVEVPEWMKEKAGGSTGRVKPHTPVSFDNETLGGYVDYSTIVASVRHLEGDLKGLIIRYDLTPSTPTGAVQGDA